MERALRAAGATAHAKLYAGGHDWELWNSHVDGMLAKASFGMGPPRPIRRLGRGPAARRRGPAARRRRHGPGVRRSHAHRRHTRRRQGVHRRGAARYVHRRRHARVVPLTLAADTFAPTGGHLCGGRLRGRGRIAPGLLVGELLLALASAALINLGFLLQHRGLSGGAGGIRAALRNRTWLAGQGLGWIGFVAQIAAVVIAPLSLVQAFAAGGLALSVPLAARLFHHRITRQQRLAVLLIACGLAVLPVAASTVHDRLAGDRLAFSALVAVPAGLLFAGAPRGPWRAIAAGIFYGAADAAIKAVSVNLGPHGAGALFSAWTAVAALGTFAGFLAFQSALAVDSAIGAISLMNGFAALTAMICGLLAFGESLGADPAAIAVHLVAITVVLGCVPKLAAAQAEMAQSPLAHGRAPAPSAPAAEY
jgi:hypothetical protein